MPLKKSDPVVGYRETVKTESSMTALSKSQNKHNRIFAVALPLGDEVTTAIENGVINPRDDFKSRARVMADDFGWDVTDARKIWCFGPDTTGPNLMCDATKGVQYLNEIKDSCVAAFQWATREGVCIEETMRGVRINILDVTVRDLYSPEPPFTYDFESSSMLTLSIVVAGKSSPLPVVLHTLLACWPPPVSRSPFTLSRSKHRKTRSVVATLCSTSAVVKSSPRSRGRVHPCSQSRLTSPSWSPSDSTQTSAPRPADRLSPRTCSIIGKCAFIFNFRCSYGY